MTDYTIYDESGEAILDEAGAPIEEEHIPWSPSATQPMLHRNVLAALAPVTLGPNHEAKLQVKGAHLDEIQADAHELLREMFPDTCFAMLADWERLLGLPDPCTGQLATVGLRRAAVVAKFGERRSLSKPYLIAVAAALGYTITIDNYPMRRYGQAETGGEYIGKSWANTITVNAPAVAVQNRQYGTAVYGEPYATWGFEALECAIAKLRPAHVYVVYSYDA